MYVDVAANIFQFITPACQDLIEDVEISFASRLLNHSTFFQKVLPDVASYGGTLKQQT